MKGTSVAILCDCDLFREIEYKGNAVTDMSAKSGTSALNRLC